MSRSSRSGASLVEVAVALLILSVAISALLSSAQVSARSVQAATLQLRSAQLIQSEAERLRMLPIASLVSGTGRGQGGTSAWTVRDSTSYLRIDLIVETDPVGGRTTQDTVFLYRAR